jgi:mannan endo-1,4-beta-mannosidase
MGDPPHEPQGWYSVFDVDESTKDVIRRHAAALHAVSA